MSTLTTTLGPTSATPTTSQEATSTGTDSTTDTFSHLATCTSSLTQMPMRRSWRKPTRRSLTCLTETQDSHLCGERLTTSSSSTCSPISKATTMASVSGPCAVTQPLPPTASPWCEMQPSKATRTHQEKTRTVKMAPRYSPQVASQQGSANGTSTQPMTSVTSEATATAVLVKRQWVPVQTRQPRTMTLTLSTATTVCASTPSATSSSPSTE